MQESDRQYHEVANIFPLMQGDEYDGLKADIKVNGQLEPIWLHPDGRIIDGRNRHRACIDLGIAPNFRTWDDKGSLVQFVVSLNLHRRHLASMQKAAIAVEILPMLEAEAKARQIAAGAAGAEFGSMGGRGNKKPLGENFPQGVLKEENEECRAPKSTEQAAAIVGTNERYVSDMKRYQTEAPDVFEEAKNGTINGNEAKKLARMSKEKREKVLDSVRQGKTSRLADAIKETKMEEIKETAALPTNLKYRVVYADPPWKYGNTMPDYFDEQGDHYQLMTVQEIAAMPVIDMADDNAVLFLWITSPILEESFQVVSGWGFKYKASFIWDKVKHVMGHYNSVRHEILLICTRGSCQPDVQKLFDSVQTIERTAHSTKPEEFRNIIDTIYPYGKRVELFARRKVEGWDTWGNEA